MIPVRVAKTLHASQAFVRPAGHFQIVDMISKAFITIQLASTAVRQKIKITKLQGQSGGNVKFEVMKKAHIHASEMGRPLQLTAF